MAKDYSQKSNFSSKYSPGKFISPAQKIVETLCENIARKDKKDLPSQFWKLPEWNKLFRNQIAAANKLLKTNEIGAILRVLTDKQWYWVNSLRNKKFENAIHGEALRLEAEKEINKLKGKIELKPIKVESFRKNSGSGGLAEKLDG